MASAIQIARLRSDIGADAATLPDADANEIFEEAGEGYTDTVSVGAYARVIALRRIWASSAKLTTYQQNNSMEKLSDVFAHLERLLAYWQEQTDAAAHSAAGTTTRLAGLRRRPRRIQEYPGG